MRDEKGEKASLPRSESASASPPRPSSLIPHPFTKMQAVGNDFVVVEEAAWPPGADWSAWAITLCDRKFGIGADGLIIVSPSEVADVRMRFFNPDGTEDMCGNGLRCVIQYGHVHRLLNRQSGFVETISGLRRFEGPIRARTIDDISVMMGEPEFAPEKLPMRVSGEQVLDYPLSVGDRTIPVSVVNTGSTHAVVFVESLPDDAEFFALSPQIENHPLFPERTSVIWTSITGEWTTRHGPNTLSIRIWERGAGETLGCGTGACAAAVAAIATKRLLPLPNWIVTVRSRGGDLVVVWRGLRNDGMFLSGPAEIVYEGNWTGNDNAEG